MRWAISFRSNLIEGHWLSHSFRDRYNLLVARGWESKSVEQQQDEARSDSRSQKPRLTPEQVARERQKQSLILSRQRILQQLEKAQNANHRKMLASALADLDAELARLT